MPKYQFKVIPKCHHLYDYLSSAKIVINNDSTLHDFYEIIQTTLLQQKL
jgi:hypothetical protein